MLASLYTLVLVEIGVIMLMVNLLNLLIHSSQIFVALFEIMLASLYTLVLVEIGVIMLMVNLLNLLIHFTLYLSS
jgi:hypothetical protein